MIIPIRILALVIVFALVSPGLQAQYNQKSPADILREAQERQRAIDKAGADFREKANEILEQQRRQQKAEREERDAQRRSDAEERRNANFQKNLQDSLNQQQEASRREQEQIQQTLRGNSRTPSADAPGNSSGFTQTPPPVVNTGSIADTYRQSANQYRWAAKEYRAKGQNDKADQALNEAVKYDEMAREVDSGSRPAALDPRPAPKAAPSRVPAYNPAQQKPVANKCPKCGFVDHPMSARTVCPRCKR